MATTAGSTPDTSTKERILEIALDLFIEKGYDKTSLREIADRLGFTKAALYYHFASKGDILMALHLRMHRLLADVLGETAGEPTTPELWGRILDEAVDAALANRRLFLMHERNRAAFEHLHDQDHAGEHDQIETRFRELLADRTLPVAVRVRLACSLGALMTGVMFGGEAFADVPADELGDALRGAVHDLLRGTGAAAEGTGAAPGQTGAAAGQTGAAADGTGASAGQTGASPRQNGARS